MKFTLLYVMIGRNSLGKGRKNIEKNHRKTGATQSFGMQYRSGQPGRALFALYSYGKRSGTGEARHQFGGGYCAAGGQGRGFVREK